jgi:3-methyladenine DNA glycosylase AlkD
MGGIKVEQRQEQETVGIPVPVLRDIGKEIAKGAKKNVAEFIPLTRLLWEAYGREGRVVTVYPLGAMELVEPETILPILLELCRTCITWEDSDQLSMRALEPIVRKDPTTWLPALEPWLVDENKWVRRAGITAAGRLAMKHAAYTAKCLELAEGLLFDEELDVKRAVSFAIRLSARGDILEVKKFLEKQVPPKNPAATWVLCDVIRSMTKSFLPEFASLISKYESWVADPDLSSKDRRSVESALKTLHKGRS